MIVSGSEEAQKCAQQLIEELVEDRPPPQPKYEPEPFVPIDWANVMKLSVSLLYLCTVPASILLLTGLEPQRDSETIILLLLSIRKQKFKSYCYVKVVWDSAG